MIGKYFHYFFLYTCVKRSYKDCKGAFPVPSDRRSILNKIENLVAYNLQSPRSGTLPSGKVWSRSRGWPGLSPVLSSALTHTDLIRRHQAVKRELQGRMCRATASKVQGQLERTHAPVSTVPTKVPWHLIVSTQITVVRGNLHYRSYSEVRHDIISSRVHGLK